MPNAFLTCSRICAGLASLPSLARVRRTASILVRPLALAGELGAAAAGCFLSDMDVLRVGVANRLTGILTAACPLGQSRTLSKQGPRRRRARKVPPGRPTRRRASAHLPAVGGAAVPLRLLRRLLNRRGHP